MKLREARILVTGGAGFLGSHLVDALVKRGAIVTAVDNFQAGVLENLKGSASKIHFVKGDIRNVRLVNKIVAGQDMIFHFAANASVPNSLHKPEYDFTTNVVGSQLLLRAAMRKRVRKFIFASSAAVYGPPQYLPIDEEHPLEPISPYGASKLAAEKLGLAYAHCYGLPFIGIRIFNSYGPRQSRYVVYDILKKLRRNRQTLEILGDGRQTRNLCYVDDTVAAFLLVATRKSSFRVFNVAGDEAASIKDLALRMLNILGLKQTRLAFTQSSWKGDIAKLVGSADRLRTLGFRPKVSLDDGLKKTIAYFQPFGCASKNRVDKE